VTFKVVVVTSQSMLQHLHGVIDAIRCLTIRPAKHYKYLSNVMKQQIFHAFAFPGNACCHSVQNLLSSSLLSKNVNIKMYRTILFPVLYGCETWSLTMRVAQAKGFREQGAVEDIWA
jgi:hypothetical protein